MRAQTPNRQLPLNIQLRDDALFASFYPGDNQEAYKAIKALFLEDAGFLENFIYLWGSQGAGKSHLLQAACHEAFERGIAAVYIPLKDIDNLSSKMLEDLEKLELICLDDIQNLTAHVVWQEALFHLYNRIREQKTPCRLMVSADISPLHLNITLADLKSRLSTGVTYQIHLLNDEQKLAALTLRAQARGLELNKSVADFILSHCPRNQLELFAILDKLDKASLAEQRRLTIPFVKEVLHIKGTVTSRE